MKFAAARILHVLALCVLCCTAIVATLFWCSAAAPQHGDLSHLTYTATGHMTAAFVYPTDNMAASNVATTVSARTVNGAGIELSVNGQVISPRNLGRMAVSKTGTQYDYYGVMLHPGPNELTITAIGAAGVRGDTATETVFGPGPPVSVSVSLMGHLVADGKTQAYLLVDAHDRWGHPAMAGAQVRVGILNGSATIGNAIGALASSPATDAPAPVSGRIDASAQPQTHYELGPGGRIQIPITATLVPGTLQVQVAAGDASDTESFTVAPYLRPAFVNGIVSIGAGSVPAAVDGDGRYDGGGARKERVGLFATGKAGKASSLTIAYESQNRLQQSSSLGPYVQDPNERPYQTYGDSSTVTSDFNSQDRLYARIDNGRNNAMWGQYIATAGSADGVGRYTQLLSGAKAELGLGKPGQGRLSAFTARNPDAFVSFTVPVSGLAALMEPLHPDIVVGSDQIWLISLDRRTGALLSQTPLSRNSDYTIDYATGVLRFVNIPLPFDAHFNPQALLIQYEYQGTGARSVTTGFDFSYALGRRGATKFEAGYLNDSTGMTNYTLQSETLTGRAADGQWSLSRASSSGAVPATANPGGIVGASRGTATQFTYAGRLAGNQIALDYQNTDPGYANPFGGFSVNGLQSVTAGIARHFSRNRDTLQLTLSQQRNTGSAAESLEDNVSASFHAMITNAVALTLGLQAQHQTNGPAPLSAASPGPPPLTVTGSNAQIQIGADWKPAKRLHVNVEHLAQLGGNSSVLPSQSSAEVAYDLPGEGRIYLRELFGGQAASFAESTSSYTAPALGGRATQIGLQRTLPGGTAIDTSYALANTGNGTDVYAALGVEQTFKFGKGFTGNASMQSANAAGGSAQGFTVFGSGLTYTDDRDFRASLSMQSRGGLGGGTTLSGGAAGHLGTDVAVMGSLQQTFGNGLSAVDDRVSLAYRPDSSDRLLSLFGYDRTSGGYSALSGTADVLSFDELYRPDDATEFAARYAYKVNGDGFYKAHTSLAALRARQKIGSRIDLGAELREMNVAGVSGARATDVAAELGYTIGSGTRAAVGYNFSGSVDPTLTGHPQRRGFYVTVTTLVDRIFGWGKQ